MNEPVELNLEPVSRRRTYEEVVEQIRRKILDGELRVGDRLPGERQLSEMLGVSRASVREAMRVLESMAIIRARTGTGPGSGSVIVGEPGPALGDTLIMNAALATISLDEVIDVRCMLERAAILQVIERADAASIAELRGLVEAMRAESDARIFLGYDAEFHLRLAEVSGNRLLAYLMASLRGVIHEVLSRIFPHVAEWDDLRPVVVEEHAEIVDLIEARDAAAAVERLEAHIRHSLDRIQRANPQGGALGSIVGDEEGSS